MQAIYSPKLNFTYIKFLCKVGVIDIFYLKHMTLQTEGDVMLSKCVDDCTEEGSCH